MAVNQQPSGTDPSLHQLPPQNLEAEASLLSAILIDNTALLDIVEILTPEDFYRSAHQRIFEAVTDLFARSEPVDLVTLANILKEKGHLEEIGGAAFLSNLVDTAPMAVNAGHYAKIVHDKASLRRLIAKSNLIVQKCFQDRGNVDEVLDFAEQAVFEIAEDKSRKSFHPISDLIEANIDKLEERQGNKTLITGVPSGFTDLDYLTSGFQPSDLIILAARPSMGKTAFALNMARNTAVETGTTVALFSLEMSKEQLTMRMLCSEARVDSHRLRGGFLSNDDWTSITQAASVLSEAPVLIDDAPDLTALDVRAKARRLKLDKKLGLIIIDYLQLMQGRRNTERRDLEISEISRSLKALAKELDVPVIALSQLNRKLEERTDKRPKLSDLRESGALEQDADVVMFIYRDEVYNREENNPNIGKAEIIVAKHRNGPTGDVPLAFVHAYTRFENLAREAFVPEAG